MTKVANIRVTIGEEKGMEGRERDRAYTYLFLGIIFVVALLLRLFVVFFMLPEQYKKPAIDGKEYDSIAIGIVSGEGFSFYGSGKPTSYRAPGYPTFLAAIYAVFGHNYLVVQIIQGLLGAFSCVLIFFIGKETFHETVGLWSALVAAFYDPFIYHHYYGGPAFFYSEGLYMFLLGLSVYFLIKSHKIDKVLFRILAGLFLGISSLTRPIILLFIIPVVIILSLFSLRQEKRFSEIVFKVALPIIVSFGCVITPWTLRNYKVHNHFVPVTTQAGLPFLGGNNIYARGSWVPKSTIPGYNHEFFKSLPEVESERRRFEMGFHFLKEYPERIPKLFFKKILITWSNFREMKTPVYNVSYSILLPFFAVGIVLWFFVEPALRIGGMLLLLLMVYSTFMQMLFWGDPRFRYPLEPYVIIFATFALYYFFGSSRI